MIKVSGNRPVRKTSAKYVTDEGETVDITVEYYSSTPGYMKQRLADAQKSDEDYETAVTEYEAKKAEAEKTGKPLKAKKPPMRFLFPFDDLARDLHALPDLADDKGKAFKITLENLDKLDTRNLNAIREAIKDDIAGKKSVPAE